MGKDGGFSEVKLAAELERIDNELDGDRTDTNSEVSVAPKRTPTISIWLCFCISGWKPECGVCLSKPGNLFCMPFFSLFDTKSLIVEYSIHSKRHPNSFPPLHPCGSKRKFPPHRSHKH